LCYQLEKNIREAANEPNLRGPLRVAFDNFEQYGIPNGNTFLVRLKNLIPKRAEKE